MEKELKIGMHLVFIDEYRLERDALLLAIHGEPKGNKLSTPKEGIERMYWPCVNLVVVDKNTGAQDQYGRQTVKENITSVVHWSDSTALGFCWRFHDEEVTGTPEPTIS